MIAAVVDDFGAEILQLGDDGAVILLAGIDAFEVDLLDAGFVELVLDDGGEAFAVGGLVVQDRDLLALVFLGDPRGDEGALRVVAAVERA